METREEIYYKQQLINRFIKLFEKNRPQIKIENNQIKINDSVFKITGSNRISNSNKITFR